MDENLIPILLGLGIAAVLAVAYASYRAGKRRQAAFSAFGLAHGLTYYPEDPFGIADWPFEIFGKGDGRAVENVLHGEWHGAPVRAFDYWYYERSSDGKGGSSKTYYRFTCAVAPIEAACHHLTVDEENFLTRLADALTLRDIPFESEEFNRAFNVKSDDLAFAHAFIDARMIAWMLEQGDGVAYEVLGDKLLLIRRQIDAAMLEELLASIVGFRQAVPRVVFSLYPRTG